ncbi:MAG: type II toxin-antitoxin system ParD family antitoxin [Geminicoccaceae bacterium]|nr:type II toxin-antitoxin system ParD family antitoxin [Geminicoccaceae bacterium]
MPADRAGHTTVTLGATKEVAQRLVAEGHFESISEACREGLRRLETERQIIDRLVALGEEGMASGIDETFDIDRMIEDMEEAG